MPIPRIIEIDATPYQIPSEVAKLLGSALTMPPTACFEMKAGELNDADYPQSHSSYYVATRSLGTAESDHEADEFLKLIASRARALRLPLKEITTEHPEFTDLVAQLCW